MSHSNTLRPLSVGEILDGAFAVYRGHAATFFGTAAIVLAPVLAMELAGLAFGVSVLFIAALTFAAQIAVTRLVSDVVLGRSPAIGSAISAVFRRLLPTIGAMFVVGVIAIPWAIVFGIGLSRRNWMVVFFGVVVFAVGVIVLLFRYFAVVPVVVIEADPHPLKRSGQLAANSRGKIFGVMTVAWILAAIPQWALNWLTGSGGRTEPSLAVQLSSLLITIVVLPFSVGVTTLLYYDQRVRKEGLDVKLAAAEASLGVPSTPAPQP
jgi:hypothetical protein